MSETLPSDESIAVLTGDVVVIDPGVMSGETLLADMGVELAEKTSVAELPVARGLDTLGSSSL
jgi:hypothetical protein